MATRSRDCASGECIYHVHGKDTYEAQAKVDGLIDPKPVWSSGLGTTTDTAIPTTADGQGPQGRL